ncbi:GNAT family N-acetyltransferase [Candidatus Binatia bacterium]|nr:GNAT family N-acetyltransferase [Candidatus Binatia bacterium]
MGEPHPAAAQLRSCTEAYLAAIAARGVDAFLANGRGLAMVLRPAGGRTVPLLVSDGRPGKPAIASPTAHHLGYPSHEIGRAQGRIARLALRAATRPVEAVLRLTAFDRVVFVNHWLFPSAPPLPAARDQLARLLESVVRDWPDHAVVVPGVVPALSAELLRVLVDLGGRAVPSRVVHLQRPGRSFRGGRMRSVRHNRNADFAVYARHAPRATSNAFFLAEQAERIAELYRQLYLERHPAWLNPQLTPAFFRLLIQSGAFEVCGWTDDGGRLVAFNVRLIGDGVIWWTVGGYDTTLPRSRGLYRLISTDDVAAVEERGLLLNQGAGNGDFKRRRGAEPAAEFEVVFDRHLAPQRRLPWQLLERARRWRVGRATVLRLDAAYDRVPPGDGA